MYITGSQDTKDVKVVRALWGSYLDTITPPQYNEVVYVWGSENKSKLDNLGYTTIRMSKNEYEWGYESVSYYYTHKLFAIQKALEEFDKILFLDWDIKLVKELDDNFFNQLPTNSFQAPIYRVTKEHIQNIPFIDDSFIGLEKKYTPNFTWEYNDSYAKINASCIYTDIKNFGNDLIKIVKQNSLGSYVEEFAIHNYSNKTLNDYIVNNHPNYISIAGDNEVGSHLSTLVEFNPYFSY